MHFTREPIIETVITPREGCKLVVRSSKGNGQEDYYVDAVEVVSFGHSFFFRSLEKPKSFLVPVSDYEILELRETRMVLKNVSAERSIKIGGGRDAPPRLREPAPRETSSDEEAPEPVLSDETSPDNKGGDRKRDRRRRGRRGGSRERGAGHPQSENPPAASATTSSIEGTELTEGPSSPEEPKAPSFISKLFPPPPTLIKETLSRYKVTESMEEEFREPPSEEQAHFPDEDLGDLPEENEKPFSDEREFEE